MPRRLARRSCLQNSTDRFSSWRTTTHPHFQARIARLRTKQSGWAAAFLEVHRYNSLNLSIFAVVAFSVWVPSVIYGIPNIARLLAHACKRSAAFTLSYDTFWRKAWFLVTKGKPAQQGSNQLSLNTWRMTMLAIGYVVLLISCIPAFGFLPICMVAKSFPNEVRNGDIGPVLRSSLVIVSIVTVLACGLIALFCTVATFDPLFRAVIGFNLLRPQVRIDIEFIRRSSRAHDKESGVCDEPPAFTMDTSPFTQIHIDVVPPLPTSSTSKSLDLSSLDQASSHKSTNKEVRIVVEDTDGSHYSHVRRSSI